MKTKRKSKKAVYSLQDNIQNAMILTKYTL